MRLFGLRDPELALGNDFDADRREQRPDLRQLARIAARNDEFFHNPSDCFCSPTSSPIPFPASDSRASSSLRKRGALGRALDFDETARPGHHHVHVGVALGIFGVVQVEDRHALVHADRHGGDKILERHFGNRTARLEPGERVVHGDEGARDRCRARAAVGLEHVAVDLDRALAQARKIDDRAHRPPDEPLDLLRAARLLAARRLAIAARVRRARQHAVLGREPALARGP